MKKRIISAILVIVMSVMALASCAPAFNFAEDDLSAYVSFDYDKFIEALGEVKIKEEIKGDFAFTTNEATRQEKVIENLFASISSTIIKNALESDKKETGVIGDKDVVYYCYYVTDADGNVFFYKNMKESTISSSVSADTNPIGHVIELGSVGDDDELQTKIKEALLNGDGDNFDFGDGEGYNSIEKSDYDNNPDLGERRISLTDKIVISYKRSFKYNIYKTDDDGNFITMENPPEEADPTNPNNYEIESTKTINQTCSFEFVNLSGEGDEAPKSLIAKRIAELLQEDIDGKKEADEKKESYTDKLIANVGAQVTYKKDNTTEKEFLIDGTLADGQITAKGTNKDDPIKYTYTDVNIGFKIDRNSKEIEIDYDYYDEEKKIYPDSLHDSTTAGKVDLDGKKEDPENKDEKIDLDLTYHIFPVYYISIPEISAESILQYIVAKNITDTYFDVFEEDYKNENKTVSDLVKEIKDLFSETYETGDSASETHKNLTNLKKALTDAEAAKKAAKEDLEGKLQDAVDAAKEAYTKAQREAIATAIAALTAAKKGEDTLGAKLLEEHKENTYDKLEDEYETHITEAVEKAVYKLIFDNKEICKVTGSYPEKLVKEFAKHLYEDYEHSFYNDKYSSSSSSSSSSTSESNYKHYKGNLQSFLYDKTGAKDYLSTAGSEKAAIDAAIEQEAKDAIEPLLKLYAAAKALNDKGAANKVAEFVNADILDGAYKARYEDNDLLSAKENKEAKELAEKNAKQNEEDAKENASKFLVTDKVFKEYKKAIGSSAYRSYEKQYGEINIRASLQFNRLFYYLTCTDLDDGEEESSIAYTTPAEGEDKKIAFRNELLKYTIVEDDHDHDHEEGEEH